MADDINTPTVFDAQSADRIAEVVRRVENVRDKGLIGDRQRSEVVTIWAKITGSTLTGSVWHHSWDQYYRDNSTVPTFTAVPSGDGQQTGTTSTNFAVNIDGSRTPTNNYVILRLDLIDEDNDDLGVIWTIVSPPQGFLFPVALTQTGGLNGDDTTAVTYTYTVKNLAGDTLGTAKSPSFRPFATGMVTAATTGTAYYDATGTIVLKYADEVWGTTQDCDAPA